MKCWRCLSAAMLVAGCLQGCGGNKDGGAEAQYSRLLGALRAGNLVSVYEEVLPPSYQADLSRVYGRMRALVTKEDLGKLREFAARIAEKLAPHLAPAERGSPVLTVVAAKLQKLPEVLGLDALEAFQSRDIPGILRRLEKELFPDLLEVESYRRQLAATRVALVEEKGSWAKLRFTTVAGDGSASEDMLDVILTDGKWVPVAWVVDWPRQVAGWEEWVTRLEAQRKANPRLILEAVAGWDKLLQEPAALMAAAAKEFPALAPASEGKTPAGQ